MLYVKGFSSASSMGSISSWVQSALVPYKFRPIATTPAELKICVRFVLSQVQPFMEKSNNQNPFAYKKARSTLDAVGLLAHTIAKSLDGGLKVQKTVFVDFGSAFNTTPRSQILDRLSSLGAPSSIVAVLFHQQATTSMPKWSVLFISVQQRGCSAGSRSFSLSILLAH